MCDIDGDIFALNIKFANAGFNSEAKLNVFMVELVEMLGLKPVFDTLVSKFFSEPEPVGEGYTGIMILLTSHVAYHTWGEQLFMRLEISVCKKDVDYSGVIAFVNNFFGKDNVVSITQKLIPW